MRPDFPCSSRDALTLEFTVRGRTLHIERALDADCFVSAGLVRDLKDITLRIKPLPLELSPSGLPVGTLEGRVPRTSGERAVSTVRLPVRPDGTGTLIGGGGCCGYFYTRNSGAGYELEFTRLGPGRIAAREDGAGCLDGGVFTFTFTLRGRTVALNDAESTGCPITKDLAADLIDAELRVLP
jgi:hypothetical protein